MAKEIERLLTAMDKKIDANKGGKSSKSVKVDTDGTTSVICDPANYIEEGTNGIKLKNGYQPLTTTQAAKLDGLPNDLDSELQDIKKDIAMFGDSYFGLENSKLDASKANVAVVTGVAVSGEYLVYTTKNIATGSTNSLNSPIPMADDSVPGFMTTAHVKELITAQDDIVALQGQKADKSQLNQVVAVDAKFTGTGDNKYITTDKKNLDSGATSSSQSQVTLATPTEAGLMGTSDKKALDKAVQDIAQLQGASTTWLVDLTGAVDPHNPTQGELQDAYEAVSGGGAAPDQTQLFDNVTGLTFKWFDSSSEWVLMSTPQVGLFTNSSAGLILGTPSNIVGGEEKNDGKVFAEADGSGSVLGWGELKGKVENVESELTTTNSNLTALEGEVDTAKGKIATAETEIAALKVQVFNKNTPLLGDVSDYSALIAKLTTEGYYV